VAEERRVYLSSAVYSLGSMVRDGLKQVGAQERRGKAEQVKGDEESLWRCYQSCSNIES